MGIPSFTKYLEDRSTQFFEKYELHNCSLVIDAHSICNNLYNWQHAHWKTGYSPYCYGGDYDKYAEIVKRFFNSLLNNSVTPYIIFDGCCESNKVSLVRKRLNEKAKINSEITPGEIKHHMYAVGATALRYAFRDVIVELKLKAFTCTNDANRQMATLSGVLRCPVLSADSDFFISSPILIPFSSICFKNEGTSATLFTCKLYKMKNLINALNNRPALRFLIPVLLGNNQFNTDIFNPFFKKIRIFGGRQKKIEGIFQWLRGQKSLVTAVEEIMKSFPDGEEKLLVNKIMKRTVKGYMPADVTILLEQFDITANQNSESLLSCERLDKVLGMETENDHPEKIPELFRKKFTECQYPAFFMDMLMANRYFVWPNIEDCSKPDANTIGYKIMSAIHNILVQSGEKQLTVLRRNSKIELEDHVLPAFKDELPSIDEIEYLQVEAKQKLIFEILEIDLKFGLIFENLPKEWHLFLLSLKYGVSNTEFDSAFIYSLIFCFITLNYVDSKLNRFCRSPKHLEDINEVPQEDKNYDFSNEKKGKFSEISKLDVFIFMQKIIKYFEEDSEDNANTYDRGIMHSIAEFQCVLLHLKYLNALLNFPFKDPFIYNIVDGTFIYNMTKDLRKEAYLKDYLTVFLQNCPGIYSEILYVLEMLETYSVL